jgi:murein DD-endopeptidase MepM/ murein hydrolase activator NlpD
MNDSVSTFTLRRFAAILFFLLSVTSASADELMIMVRPTEVYQSGVVEITVSGSGLAELKARRGAEELPLMRVDEGSYVALVGIDIEQRPGPLEVVVSGRSPDESWKRTAKINVKVKNFPREEITVPPQFDQLDAATLARINKEQAMLERIFKVSSTPRLWQGGFIAPVPGTINSAFGFRRIVNGLARAPHTGVDLKAALGAPVAAANDGRVALTDNLFFSGNSLVLDHGGGLYTMYFHLSEFRAAVGDAVHKGDLIGLAGMTGRVTGPHLHWGARLGAARIDPLDLLAIGTKR